MPDSPCPVRDHAGGPVVGFDLDMTLVDSAEGIATTLRGALADVGWTGDLTDAEIWPWIGIPLTTSVAHIAPGADPVATAIAYRRRYARDGVPLTRLMPGARSALAAVRALGGRVLVISAKAPAGVHEVLRAAGLDDGPEAPDVVVGGLFGPAKGERLATEGAHVYVGDHPADVEAARVAAAVAVAVATGPVAAEDLVGAGADVVLPDIAAFASWLAGYWSGCTAGAAAASREVTARPGAERAPLRGARAGGVAG